MTNIHPTALIAEGADVHPSVQVGPFCIIDAGAVVGADCVLESQVRIYGTVRIGCSNHLYHGVTLGTEPQDLIYTPEKARPLIIGNYNRFRENANISCGVKADHGTIIGNHNYFMMGSHVGHDSIVGDYNIIANTVSLSGHVELAHHVFISGLVAVHQFCRIGPYVMIGGVTGINQDIPPYVMVNGQRGQIVGLNTVGLRRNGFTLTQRNNIKRAYRVLYRSGLRREEAILRLQVMQEQSPETRLIVEFINASSQRGLASHHFS